MLIIIIIIITLLLLLLFTIIIVKYFRVQYYSSICEISLLDNYIFNKMCIFLIYYLKLIYILTFGAWWALILGSPGKHQY